MSNQMSQQLRSPLMDVSTADENEGEPSAEDPLVLLGRKRSFLNWTLRILALVELATLASLWLDYFSFNFETVWQHEILTYNPKTVAVDAMGVVALKCLVILLHCTTPARVIGIRTLTYVALVLQICKAMIFQSWNEILLTVVVIGAVSTALIDVVLLHIYSGVITKIKAVKDAAAATADAALQLEEGEAEKTGSTGSEKKGKKKKKKGGNPDFDTGDEQHISYAKLFKILQPYFWPKGCANKIRAFSTYAAMGGSQACYLLAPTYIGDAIADLSNSTITVQQKAYKSVLIFAALKLGYSVLREVQNTIYQRVMQTAFTEISESTYRHFVTLSLNWHLKKSMGTVIRAMDRGIASANTMVKYVFLYLLPTIVSALITFGIFYAKFKSPYIAATTFVCLLGYVLVTIGLTLWRKKYRTATNKHDNDYHDKATDCMINFETVKIFANEEYEIDRFAKAVNRYQKYSVMTQVSLSILNSSQQFLIQLCTAAGLCIATYMVSEVGTLTAGDATSIYVYIAQLFTPLSFLGTIYGVVIQAYVDMANLAKLLGVTSDVNDLPGAPDLQPRKASTPADAIVEFKDVYFHYPGAPATTGIKNMSFSIPYGTTCGLVGTTGAGKTTIGRLLFRFYDVTGGAIRVYGQDVATVTQHSLRCCIGMVPQDTVLFNNTLMYNLCYAVGGDGFDEYSETREVPQRVIDACKAANILDFIVQQPLQWDTVVGERGLKLSGGEKQRISIARCLLKNPPIVILDEATSALDSVTESLVQEALDVLAENRTTIVIAHRLSTIRNAHQILVLSKGEVIERGNHRELVEKQGVYADMWNTQISDQQQRIAGRITKKKPAEVKLENKSE